MVSGMELIPERREILRYLGYKGAAPDEEILREIDVCVDDLNKAVTPRFVYEKFALSRERTPDTAKRSSEDATAEKGVSGENNAEELLCFAGIRVSSKDLSANLRDCCGVYLMAVTLGPGPDRLVRRASVGRMSRAVIYQAALQREISRILNMPKEIGVSLTDTMLMTPSKSVTALIGVSSIPAGHKKGFRKTGCADCPASADCAYAMPDSESVNKNEKEPA